MTCQFVPPYLLARVAEATGDPEVSRCCAQTRSLDTSMRERRTTAAPSLARPADADGNKTIYSARNTERLPGDKVRGDDEPPTGDAAVDEAYDSTGVVHEMFHDEFGRSGLDGAGSPVTVTVHYGIRYDNAFWDGRQLVFGDGDGEVFERFTKPPDVLFHEFAHGVTQFTADLRYSGQSGALNESMSDCFAAMALQRSRGQQASEADWLIGAGLFRPQIQAVALRSMIEPGTAYDDPLLGKDPQVGHMGEFVVTAEDNGGVHLNSGIPNRAFVLAAQGLGGASWEAAGQVWYAALTGPDVGAATEFAGFAAATVAAAETRLGSSQALVVGDAWREVGVEPGRDVVRDEPQPPATGRIVVRRSGGFTGIGQESSLDLDDDPAGVEVARLLARTRLTELAAPSRAEGAGGADRFTYTFVYRDEVLSVGEDALTPELRRIVSLVMRAER